MKASSPIRAIVEAADVDLAHQVNSNARAWKDIAKGAQSAWEDWKIEFQEASRE
jgi:hypothetical protein